MKSGADPVGHPGGNRGWSTSKAAAHLPKLPPVEERGQHRGKLHRWRSAHLPTPLLKELQNGAWHGMECGARGIGGSDHQSSPRRSHDWVRHCMKSNTGGKMSLGTLKSFSLYSLADLKALHPNACLLGYFWLIFLLASFAMSF